MNLKMIFEINLKKQIDWVKEYNKLTTMAYIIYL